jgi:hypothetical protein
MHFVLPSQANFTPAWMTTLFFWVHRLGGKDGSAASVTGNPVNAAGAVLNGSPRHTAPHSTEP